MRRKIREESGGWFPVLEGERVEGRGGVRDSVEMY